jgi:hypothetical protein
VLAHWPTIDFAASACCMAIVVSAITSPEVPKAIISATNSNVAILLTIISYIKQGINMDFLRLGYPKPTVHRAIFLSWNQIPVVR